jgi:two-component system cell cycle response regulator
MPRRPRSDDDKHSTRRQRARSSLRAKEEAPKRCAQLTVLSGSAAGRAFPVPEAGVVIGRGPKVDLRVEDPGVSGEHARISCQGGRYVLQDLGSTNGTYVAAARVERVHLSSGDRIRLGATTVLTFAVLDAEAERIVQSLYESSVRDALTGAHNRRYFDERLAGELGFAKRHGAPLAVALFDVDHFKRINDEHGHAGGDQVLRDVTRVLTGAIRKEDVLARYGGEEFALIVRGIQHPNVGRCAERLRSAVSGETFGIGDAELEVTLSAGYASLSELADGQRSADALVKLADERLYRAKAAGRDRICGS